VVPAIRRKEGRSYQCGTRMLTTDILIHAGDWEVGALMSCSPSFTAVYDYKATVHDGNKDRTCIHNIILVKYVCITHCYWLFLMLP